MAKLSGGEIKGLLQNAGFNDAVSDAAVSVAMIESGGNTKIKARAGGSASGLFQFLDGTYEGMLANIRKKHPEIAAEMEKRGKDDPVSQTFALKELWEENASVLKKNHIAVNGISLYASHLMGVGTAAKVLGAGDNTSFDDLVKRGVISATAVARNKGFLGGTVGEFRAKVARKLGDKHFNADQEIGSFDEMEGAFAEGAIPTDFEDVLKMLFAPDQQDGNSLGMKLLAGLFAALFDHSKQNAQETAQGLANNAAGANEAAQHAAENTGKAQGAASNAENMWKEVLDKVTKISGGQGDSDYQQIPPKPASSGKANVR